MAKYWLWGLRFLFFLACGFCFLTCGSAKYPAGRSEPSPTFRKPEAPVEDKKTLTLKAEGLQLTPVSQEWKLNHLTLDIEGDKYTRLQKKFVFPIQFNGWVSLDRVEHNYLKCTQGSSQEPAFILADDHNGEVIIQPGEQVPVSLEKLYVVRLEFANVANCKSIDIQFGVLYVIEE